MSTASTVLNSRESEIPWYKHRWPWLLMLGPFIIVVASSYMTWVAVTQQDALVVDDYYKQGKAINQDLRRDRVATALGVSFTAHYDNESNILAGSVSNTARQAVDQINMRLIHATMPKKDMALILPVDQAGNFEITLPMLELGRWQVLVENAQRDWRLNGVWSWPAQKSITLKADEEVKVK